MFGPDLDIRMRTAVGGDSVSGFFVERSTRFAKQQEPQRAAIFLPFGHPQAVTWSGNRKSGQPVLQHSPHLAVAREA
jgi:hypothetical protein